MLITKEESGSVSEDIDKFLYLFKTYNKLIKIDHPEMPITKEESGSVLEDIDKLLFNLIL